MRFTQEALAQAIAEFSANAVARVVPGAGHNKDITVYGVDNGPIQKTSRADPVDAEPGNDGG